MATAPYGVRLLVGAATLAVEETIRLPKTILMYPMTLASQAAHIVMRFQQNIAELVIKGDSTLEQIFPPKEEQPEWATFDEDLDDEATRTWRRRVRRRKPRRRTVRAVHRTRPVGRRRQRRSPDSARVRHPCEETGQPSVPAPAVADELDYETLTLAQLRARLQTLDVDELEALLAYEEATKSRAPFQTLLANRITRATAK